MALNFISTDQLGHDNGIKAAVYGRSGVGKTYLVTTCPDPLFIAAEPGTLTLRHFPIKGIKITCIEDLEDTITWIYNAAEARPFQTIYVDSATEIGEVILANAKLTNTDPRKAYGELIDRMLVTLKQFRDIPNKHVVLTFKQESNADEVSKTTMYGPAMPGRALPPAIPYLFDEVFRLGVSKTQEGIEYRFLQTRPDLQYEGKDRSGVLDAVEPPDLGQVFNKILARK